MASVSQAAQCFQLTWSETDHGSITVTPPDEDRFNIKLNRAIEFLQQANRVDQFKQQFNVLLKVLVTWVKGRQDVKNASLTLRDGGLSFVVVRSESRYDEQFEDELSELDFKIANDVDLDLIKLDVLGLPPASEEALQTFFDPNFRLTLFSNADTERTKPSSAGQ